MVIPVFNMAEKIAETMLVTSLCPFPTIYSKPSLIEVIKTWD